MTKKKKCVMRTISAFSFVCVIVRTMFREKKCRIQEMPKEKNKKKMEYRKKCILEPVHTAWLQNVTHPRSEKTRATAFALFRFRHKPSKKLRKHRLRYRSSVNDETGERCSAHARATVPALFRQN